MAEFLDFTGYFEQMGIKQVTGYATKSTHKNATFKAAIAGDLKPLQEEILDPLNEVFLSTVRVNRDGKLDAKPGRKMGHLNITGKTVDEVRANALAAAKILGIAPF